MTQHIFWSDKSSWSIREPHTVFGKRGWTASHALVGTRVDFYVFTRAAGASARVTGQPERHDALKRLHVSHQKDAFIALVEKILSEHPHPG